jgi:hypothetical protein
MNPWFLGAYAGYASFADKNKENDAYYMRGLEELPHIAGLELPFYSDLSETNSDKFLRTLPKHWDYIITLLPGTMQSLSKQPEFGIASTSAEGRRAAMSRMAVLHRRVHEINNRCGRSAVRAIELHSAPTRPYAEAQYLYASLEELESWDWQGAQLLIEHCDSWQPEGGSIKGFLPLKDELGVLRDLDVKLSLNWGRSVLEERDPLGALNHIKLSQNQLGAFFFSGTSLEDPVYGSWQDSHVPMMLGSAEPWEPAKGLLTPERVVEAIRELNRIPGVLLGIKVQPTPPSLTIDQRLEFLGQQIRAFEKARASV